MSNKIELLLKTEGTQTEVVDRENCKDNKQILLKAIEYLNNEIT